MLLNELPPLMNSFPRYSREKKFAKQDDPLLCTMPSPDITLVSYDILPAYKTIVLQHYKSMLRHSGDFDEYWFLSDGDAATTTSLNFNLGARHALIKPSPQPSFQFQLATVSWLQHVLLDRLDAPSSDLLALCTDLSVDIAEIVSCVHKLLESVFQIGKQSTDALNVDSSHFTVIAKLFFKLLEELINTESHTASRFHISALLRNQLFRSVLACSITIILYCYRISGLSVSSLLGRLSIDWFSFGKILPEIIDMHALGIPPDLEDYLHFLESKVLLKKGWTSKSPIFEKNSVETAPPTESSLATAQGIFNTPRKPAIGKYITDRTLSQAQTPHSIKVFMLKVFDLVAQRLNLLVQKLSPQSLLLYELSGKAVVNSVCSCKSELLRDRHLDQMLLCSVYGVSKARGFSLRFKEIIAAYDSLPYAKSKVYRNVLLKEGNCGDIIEFYNVAYLPVMETFLQKLAGPVKQQIPQDLINHKPLNAPPVDTTSESSDSVEIELSPDPQTPQKSTTSSVLSPSNASVPMSPSRCAVIDFRIGSSPARAFAHVNQILSRGTESPRHPPLSLISGNRLPPLSPGSSSTGRLQPLLPVKRPVDPENAAPGATPAKRLRVDPTLPVHHFSSLTTPTSPKPITPSSTH